MDEEELTDAEAAHRWRLLQAQTIINCRRSGKNLTKDADGHVVPDHWLTFKDCEPAACEMVRKARGEMEGEQQ